MNSEKMTRLENQLNHTDTQKRLMALEQLKEYATQFKVGNDVNNHIHTTYSFSPYSPTKAIYMARISGLKTAGIMDHDSIAGAEEFITAGNIIDMDTTIGVECRVGMKDTFLKERRINNPDQIGVAYCAIHGIPHTQIDIIKQYFDPFIENRMKRNFKMVNNINRYLKKYDITLDFQKDVISISLYKDGGTVTERHILFALANKLIEKFGKGNKIVGFLKNELGAAITSKAGGYLNDIDNDHYDFDLLGVLKTDLISKIYIDATNECPDVKDFIELAKKTGSISAYAYLGDIENSVTGDKKAQKFEDEYIEELFKLIKKLGFDAVTYMPSRNTKEQLDRVKRLCDEYELFQISGEDINQPRQKFVCEAMRKPEFQNLVDATYALINHEKEATKDINMGMFSKFIVGKIPGLKERINYFISLDN